MTAIEIADLPVNDLLVTPAGKVPNVSDWHITSPWLEYLTRLQSVLATCQRRVSSVSLTEQSASISATDFSGGGLAPGLYEISYYVRVTQAAGTSSSLFVTFEWLDGSIVISQNSATLTGNTTSTYTSAPVPIHVDVSSPVRYSTTYASTGSPVMKYALYITLKELPQ